MRWMASGGRDAAGFILEREFIYMNERLAGYTLVGILVVGKR